MIIESSPKITGASDNQIRRWLYDIDWDDDDSGWAYPFWSLGLVADHHGISPAEVVTEARKRNIK